VKKSSLLSKSKVERSDSQMILNVSKKCSHSAVKRGFEEVGKIQDMQSQKIRLCGGGLNSVISKF